MVRSISQRVSVANVNLNMVINCTSYSTDVNLVKVFSRSVPKRLSSKNHRR